MSELRGRVRAPFDAVAERFLSHFRAAGEIGAALCVWHRGEVVVDIQAGRLGPADPRPWQADTLVNVFSVTKGLMAALCLRLQEQGRLDLDEPLSATWSELRGPGREAITWRQVLNHRCGLVAVDEPLSLEQIEAWEPVERALLRARPGFPPGEAQAYHAVTFGMLLRAGLVRRFGRSVGALLREELLGPLGAEVELGLPPERDPRVATLVPLSPWRIPDQVLWPLLRGGSRESAFLRNVLLRPSSPGSRAVRQPKVLGGRALGNYNLPRVRRMELPWANAHASARGLARVYQALLDGRAADGSRLFSSQALGGLAEPQSWSSLDLTMRKPLGFCQGFMKEEPGVFSPGGRAFGHPGVGGCLGWADPEHELAIGYTMNRLRPQVRSPTARGLCAAIYAALGRRLDA